MKIKTLVMSNDSQEKNNCFCPANNLAKNRLIQCKG